MTPLRRLSRAVPLAVAALSLALLFVALLAVAAQATSPIDSSSADYFVQAGKTLQSPRCLNCHPNADSPTQTDTLRVHYPPVIRGPGNDGVVGMRCTTCHQDHNPELARIPGAPSWRLAPLSMAWQGKTLAQICAQMKDPARNGGRTLAQIVDHVSNDALVGWGWHPGQDRVPAPGTQKEFGDLMAKWVTSGAECPPGDAK